MRYGLAISCWFSLVILLAVGVARASDAPAMVGPAAERRAAPADGPEVAYPADSIWLVSTRHLGGSPASLQSGVDLDIRRYSGDEGWREASLGEFLAENSASTITLVYVHGNRFDSIDAIQHGWTAYHALASPAHTAKPVRFVIWSWPSSQIRGALRDVRSKAHRSDGEGLYLGWFLAQLDAGSPLSLIGHSYGARIITGALHLLGGGQLRGLTLPTDVPYAHARVVLTAAALDNGWLVPGGYHGRAYRQVDHLLSLHNSTDPVLKRYRFLDRCRRPAALGYTGFPACDVGSAWAERLTQMDVIATVGRTHRELAYSSASNLMSWARGCLLWEPIDAGVVGTQRMATAPHNVRLFHAARSRDGSNTSRVRLLGRRHGSR